MSEPEIRNRVLPPCGHCRGRLVNHGATTRGDGEMFDYLVCLDCGAEYEWHAAWCRCGCGGGLYIDTQPFGDV
jgi:hypothetical protein